MDFSDNGIGFSVKLYWNSILRNGAEGEFPARVSKFTTRAKRANFIAAQRAENRYFPHGLMKKIYFIISVSSKHFIFNIIKRVRLKYQLWDTVPNCGTPYKNNTYLNFVWNFVRLILLVKLMNCYKI